MSKLDNNNGGDMEISKNILVEKVIVNYRVSYEVTGVDALHYAELPQNYIKSYPSFYCLKCTTGISQSLTFFYKIGDCCKAEHIFIGAVMSPDHLKFLLDLISECKVRLKDILKSNYASKIRNIRVKDGKSFGLPPASSGTPMPKVKSTHKVNIVECKVNRRVVSKNIEINNNRKLAKAIIVSKQTVIKHKGIYLKTERIGDSSYYRILEVSSLTPKHLPTEYLEGCPNVVYEDRLFAINHYMAHYKKCLVISTDQNKAKYRVSAGLVFEKHMIEKIINNLSDCGDRLTEINKNRKLKKNTIPNVDDLVDEISEYFYKKPSNIEEITI